FAGGQHVARAAGFLQLRADFGAALATDRVVRELARGIGRFGVGGRGGEGQESGQDESIAGHGAFLVGGGRSESTEASVGAAPVRKKTIRAKSALRFRE